MRRSAPWTISIFLALCLIIVAIGYLRSRSEARRLETKLNLLAEDDRKLRTQLASTEKSREASERAVQELKAKISATSPATPQRRKLQGLDSVAMFKNPASKPLWRRIERRTVAHVYGAIIEEMKLPTDQIGKLMDLIVEQTETGWDANEASQAANLSSEESEKARHAAENAVNDQITALVGPGNAALLKIAEASLPPSSAPQVVQYSIGMDLSLAGVPLSPEQFSAAALVYNDARPYAGYPTGIPDDETPDPTTGLTPYYSALLDRLSQTLTPAQIGVVKDYYVEQIQLQQYKHQIAEHPP